MTIFNTLSDNRFSLNGVQYLKNYISEVRGNRVEVFNCYERADVLLPLTHYAQVSVNGTVYSSALLLQEALLNVLYYRNNLVGNGITEQNNVARRFTLLVPNGVTSDTLTTQWAADQVNNIFVVRTISEIDTPVTFIARVSLPGGSEENVFEFRKGKGSYGGSNPAVLATDFYKRPVVRVPAVNVIEDPATQTIHYSLAPGQNVSQWLNAQNPGIEIQPQQDGYVIFNDGTATYLWLGDGGLYGLAALQSTDIDFQLIDADAPAPGIPSWQSTLEVNRTATVAPEIFMSGVRRKIGSNREAIQFSNGKTLQVLYNEAVNDWSLTFPELGQDDRVAYLSTLQNALQAQTLQTVLNNSPANAMCDIQGVNIGINSPAGTTKAFMVREATNKRSSLTPWGLDIRNPGTVQALQLGYTTESSGIGFLQIPNPDYVSFIRNAVLTANRGFFLPDDGGTFALIQTSLFASDSKAPSVNAVVSALASKVNKAGDTLTGTLNVADITPVSPNVSNLGSVSNPFLSIRVSNNYSSNIVGPSSGTNFFTNNFAVKSGQFYSSGRLELGNGGTYTEDPNYWLKVRGAGYFDGSLTTRGLMNLGQFTNGTEPSYVKGAMYFNTTINKMRVGGATGWETVTSTL